MNPQERIPRTRGGICGTLLILLGLWGGLVPFAGPYFHFGYLPDHAWHFSTGRLYFSAIPGAAAVIGGLLAVGTRNRGIGSIGGLLAALGGAWFVVGTSVVSHVLHKSIPVGSPILSPSSPAVQGYLEQLALFTGVGLVLVFFGALTMGRFSLAAGRDAADEEDSYSYYGDLSARPSILSATGQLPARQSAGGQPGAGPGRFTPPAEQVPLPGSYSDAGDQEPAPLPDGYPDTGDQEPTTAQYPPEPMR